MTVIGWIQILLYCAIVVALVKPLGWYMTRVFAGERTFLSPVLRPVERGLYWIGGVDERPADRRHGRACTGDRLLAQRLRHRRHRSVHRARAPRGARRVMALVV